jgi:hypothetical protein
VKATYPVNIRRRQKRIEWRGGDKNGRRRPKIDRFIIESLIER